MREMIDIPPVWLMLALLLAWGQSVWLPFGPAPGMLLRTLGWGLIACGVGLVLLAAFAFWRHRTTIIPHQVPERIITAGVFGFSRNPIYLGDALVLAGACCVMGAWPSLVLVFLFVWWISVHFIRAEEDRMRTAFGAEFEGYARKVRRWL